MMVRAVQLLRSELAPNVVMPLIGFGTFRLTGADTVYQALDAALATGYRLIDTAQLYENEADIGNSLKTLLPKHGLKRENIFITTKLHYDNMGKEKTRVKLLESLKKLQVDFVDLMLIHYPKAGWLENKDPRNKDVRRESWFEMEKLQAEGKTRAIGVSNFEIRHLEEMKQYQSPFGILPAVNQCEFHPHYCRFELVEYCHKNNMQFQAFTSLGRYNKNLHEEPTLKNIAEVHGVSVSQVLLAWPMLLNIGIIPKSSHPDRIKENFQATELCLNDREIQQIRALNRGVNYTKCTPWDVA